MNGPTDTGEDGFRISRRFDAPRPRVWRAWSDARSFTQWWGPKGCQVRILAHAFRPGGRLHYSLKTPDGHEIWGRFVYLEIEEPVRIVFINSFSDAMGNITRAPFDSSWPLEVMNILSFGEANGGTLLRLESQAHNATAAERATFRAGHASLRHGFGGAFDQLEEHLARVAA